VGVDKLKTCLINDLENYKLYLYILLNLKAVTLCGIVNVIVANIVLSTEVLYGGGQLYRVDVINLLVETKIQVLGDLVKFH